MPRGTTRSQKPSQSQPTQPTRSQKRRAQDPKPQEEEEEDDEGNMDVDDDEDAEPGGQTDVGRMACALVRLALFTEHKRTPLRRDEISKKVLGANTRAFAAVFAAAQTILRKTFAMELVELRSRAELDKDAAGPGKEAQADDLDEARQATGVKKKAAAAGSKTYILRSTLDARIIEHAALTDEQILEDEAADAPSDDDDDDEYSGNIAYGSILSWSSADQLGPIGILYVVLSLILVSGRVIGDHDLRNYLKRLRLPLTGTVNFSAQATHRTLSVEAYLTGLMRQGYIDKHQIGASTNNAGKKGGKRSRATQGDEDGQTYEWRWGNRAQSEVGEQALAKFVAEFMVVEGRAEEQAEEEEGEGTQQARARAKKREKDQEVRLDKMIKGIERAAGGQLAEIK
ncbi:MAGE-domain-containing protein [Mycena rebaudengoi]|nr:MAGE-domain-containing protein [Mycena rebaudengoi]